MTPTTHPRWAPLLAQRLMRLHETDTPLAILADIHMGRLEPAHPDSRVRHSDAAGCECALAYTMTGTPESDPMDVAGVWQTTLGKILHHLAQDALAAELGDKVEIEGEYTLDLGGGHISACHADAVVDDGGRRELIEFKFPGSFGFDMAVGAGRGPAKGPKFAHIVQTALNALACDAEVATVCYGNTGAISRQRAERLGLDDVGRVCAEWTFDRDQWEPLARWEMARWRRVIDTVDGGGLPDRRIPNDEGVEETPTSRSGHWLCQAYCRYRTLCWNGGGGSV